MPFSLFRPGTLPDQERIFHLTQLFSFFGPPLIIVSAYRTPEHNVPVGGAEDSQHLFARAFDVSMTNLDPHTFEEAARTVGFTGFGF